MSGCADVAGQHVRWRGDSRPTCHGTTQVKAAPRIRHRAGCGVSFQGGFTLIELLTVLALVAMATAAVTLAWRDPAADRLQREAERLVMLLETARSEARAAGLALGWQPLSADRTLRPGTVSGIAADFEFLDPQGQPLAAKAALSGAGFGVGSWPRQWLTPGVQATVNGPLGAGDALRLGPEAMIGAQRVVLALDGQRREIATEGLAPFEVRPGEAR